MAQPPPSSGVAVVWFKATDLRLRDHEPLAAAHRAFARVVHLFVFDPVWHGVTPRARLPKCGHWRARFLLEAVADLRTSLRARGSELVVRCGDSATVVAAVARAVGAAAVHTHREVCPEELAVETRVRAALEAASLPPLRTVWGGQTMYHIEDLGLNVTSSLPAVFTQFRRHVEARSRLRPPLDIPSPFRVRQ